MPLTKGFSKAAISKNIKMEKKAGRPHKQSIAIALGTARTAAKKRGVPLSKIKGLKPAPKKKG